jgi:ferrous-iron efflux pump FieF
LSIGASLADSALDLSVSLGGLVAILYAAKPADDDHAFGHSSAEDIAALGQSVFIAISAVVIAFAAIMRLLRGMPPLAEEESGIAVMVISVALTLALVLWQTRVARKTGNRVIKADRLHYLGDLIPGIGAILALWVSSNYGINSIDAVVALAAAGVLVVGAFGIGKPAFDALMDRAAPAEMIAGIEQLTEAWPGVHGFHELKTRVAGSKVFVNLHIELDGEQSLTKAHGIGAGLRRAILAKYPETDVIIHKDPVRKR